MSNKIALVSLDFGSTGSMCGDNIAAIARGTSWFEELTSGKASSISDIASRENVTDSYVSRLLNLSLLSPTIVHQVLEGKVDTCEVTAAATRWRNAPSLRREPH